MPEQYLNIRVLKAWRNRIGEAGVKCITEKLVNLKDLDLSINNMNEGHNKFGDQGAYYISTLRHL